MQTYYVRQSDGLGRTVEFKSAGLETARAIAYSICLAIRRTVTLTDTHQHKENFNHQNTAASYHLPHDADKHYSLIFNATN